MSKGKGLYHRHMLQSRAKLSIYKVWKIHLTCELTIALFWQSEAGKIQVYVRVRPFTEREKEKRETNAIEIHQEHSLVRNMKTGPHFVHGISVSVVLNECSTQYWIWTQSVHCCLLIYIIRYEFWIQEAGQTISSMVCSAQKQAIKRWGRLQKTVKTVTSVVKWSWKYSVIKEESH